MQDDAGDTLIGEKILDGTPALAPVAWAMLGLFLGIFGVLIAYFTPPKRPAFD